VIKKRECISVIVETQSKKKKSNQDTVREYACLSLYISAREIG